LKKKKTALETLTEMTKEQEKVLKKEKFSMDDFESLMGKKARLIQELNQLDDGFEAFYRRLETAIQTEKTLYRNELQMAQGLIGEITDLGIRLQAMEARNKEKLVQRLTEQRKEIKSFKTSSQMAERYHQNMANQHHTGQSYFLDKKK
jgi:flagellar biosynthesis/type III secretory pathway chaperone